MRILLLNNKFKENTVAMVASVARKLADLNIDVLVDDDTGEIPVQGIDMAIVLGGDGTILRAARQYSQSGMPILGVNMGTVGFLSNIEVDKLADNLARLIEYDYEIDRRMILEVNLLRDHQILKTIYSLNEVVIKSPVPHMVSFSLNINAERSGIYIGDGLIIATPTGSTGYSLSAGGPIVDPDLQAFVVTPICSHIIDKSPLIINADKDLTVVPIEFKEAVIFIDGHVKLDFQKDDHIIVKRARQDLNLINLSKKDFFPMLNSRLRRSGVLL